MPTSCAHWRATLGLGRTAAISSATAPTCRGLLSALDIFVWLSRGEGMPHVIGEAGAAGLPVIATPDNGTEEQIADGESGLFVPHRDPGAVAAGIQKLIANPRLRQRLGDNLRRKVAREYSVAALIPRWERLFDDVCTEHDARHVRADTCPQ